MKPEVFLYDTTLRDGNQDRKISLSLADKLQIAKLLDAFGFDYIEGGFARDMVNAIVHNCERSQVMGILD